MGGRSRITYGVDWSLERPKLSITSTIGQSYRFVDRPRRSFPEGTGLTGRVSDIVGRTRIRYGRFIDLTHRFRLDKDNLAVRRNEIDLTVGSEQTYAQIGYLRLNRDIDPTIEDLRDKEELRLAGRVLFQPLLVDLRRDRARPHRQERGPAVARRRLRAGARTGWASSMRTIAWSLASRGGATMSASARSAREAPSPSIWR